MKDICLVVPSIREKSINDFVERWNSIGLFDHVDLFLMEDNPTKTFNLSSTALKHFCWNDIENYLKSNSWIIPRRSDTVRSYGYLRAAQNGYKYIMTLDDDCYPCTNADGVTYDGLGFVNEHLKWLSSRSRWFNTLNSVKPRGIPYYNLGENKNTLVNHGLWTNVLDYDAPYQLANPISEKFSYDNVIVPHRSFFPMCGMNVMWRAEATVLMYHLLMGQKITKPNVKDNQLVKLSFDRFGDIWCGIFMKKIADIKGYSVSTGMPYIRHERASNPFANLKKEANGIEVNEKLWEYVDKFTVYPLNNSNQSLAECYRQLGIHIEHYDEFPEHVDYFKELGQAMQIWAGLFV